MRKRGMYGIALILILVLTAATLWAGSESREEKALIKEAIPGAQSIGLMKEAAAVPYIRDNFPAVLRIYEVDGEPAAFVTEGRGYEGLIRTLVIIDSESEKVARTVILRQGDEPEYADPIKEGWFMDRFAGQGLLEYLELVVLEQTKETDIIQVTGATISSQAVVNNVNAAMGAWQYLFYGTEAPAVENAVAQETWDKDDNSFLISPEDSDPFRITVEDLEDYEQVAVDTILAKTTGTRTDIKASGPLLSEVLASKGIDLGRYAALGVTGRDGYYAMLDKDILTNRQIILGTMVDGEGIPPEEKPVRIVVPDEMGVYWVKMVTRIDLYEQVSPKDIKNIYMFDALTRGIEPYYYEYYGSKDKSILVGSILDRFDAVDPNGFFTMLGSDGLEKNETIAIVRDRYYIKTEGNNAPMNIGPAFKLGMNVKEMCCFSTSTDAVMFSEIMMKVIGSVDSAYGSAMSLSDAAMTAGLLVKSGDVLTVYDASLNSYEIKAGQLADSILIPAGGRTDALVGDVLIKDVLKISKN